MRRLVMAAVALALAGCGDERDGTVEAADFRFEPATKRIKVGDTVDWQNAGTTDHSIRGQGFFSRAIGPGGRYSHRFTRAGDYDYICTLHPGQMRGRVTVEE